GRCEERPYDQHYYVSGAVGKLSGDLLDVITADISVWIARHTAWGIAEAREQLTVKETRPANRVQGSLTGSPIERRRWLRTSLYDKAPLFLRVFAYFIYRYFFRLGFLDGVEGLIFHIMQGFWFRFYVDAKIFEIRRQRNQQPDAERAPKDLA